nr:MAG TPA: hypothetical protein [Caudoviricetes sp.]
MIFQNGHNVEQRDTTTNNGEQSGTNLIIYDYF